MEYNIKTTIVKLITDKPVRKTPYQVKGVFIRNFKKESIVPMLDGSTRDKFLYPRVQVKILDEQIYLIGIKEGSFPVISIANKVKKLDFGNITFEVEKFEILKSNYDFILKDQLISYKFISPWVALNSMTGAKYKKLNENDRLSYLNKLIGQNIVFIANEFNLSLDKTIYVKLDLLDLLPKKVAEKKWSFFEGGFKTNCVLPNYIGLGNGITRGFGTIYFESDSLDLNLSSEAKKSHQGQLNNINDEEGLEIINVSEVPKPRRKKRRKFNKNKRLKKNKKTNRKNSIFSSKNKNNINKNKFDNNFSNPNIKNIEDEESIEEKNFNTEEHHKRQHRF